MIAYISQTNQTITGKTIKDLRNALIRRMGTLGYRGLTAVTEKGTEIHVEIYSGEDYIRTRDGRYIEAK